MACSEVDTADASKDDPVINDARQQQQRRQQQQQQEECERRNISVYDLPVDDAVRNRIGSGAPPLPLLQSQPTRIVASQSESNLRHEFAQAEDVLREKLSAATERLRMLPNSELAANKALVEFIKECADCISSLKRAATS